MTTQLAPPFVRHHLTVNDFHRMGEVGILCEDDRVELIEGELIDMAPIGSKHASIVNRLTALLNAVSAGQVIVSPQNPIRLGDSSEPQPDIAVLRHRDDFYSASHPGPTDILFLIEVADTTISYDRDVKIPLYAQHGVPEVWLIDVQTERMEIYRQLEDEEYQEVLSLMKTGHASPSLLPQLSLRLTDLWPQEGAS